ncbi:L-arabinose transport system permease protein AraQ [Clostridium liquoris]|jgi:multiple sugar transport system permease protein|uniref:L-arabinose transport system permease protein AraQ n=1 Tax=Clostridium liquoris TaxID=1289519 RepID=A0A2T0B6X5_9CLOT|nr:carbohydrate ABC transporter permease [Clostridium liquoris]PRR79547.1 L-arabinose transport system permease protein AraQ [Clostridium liquoris]
MAEVKLGNENIPVFVEKESKSFKVKRVIIYSILILWCAFTILPLYFMIITSFTDPNSSANLQFSLIPTEFTLDSYKYFFTFNENVLRWLFNSLFVSSIITISNVFFASMAGYAFSKLRFPGKNKIFWMLMCAIMIPGQVTLIPLYILVKDVFNMTDSYYALIIPSLVSIYNIFLMKQYMTSIPSTLIDAARIDACSEFGIYRKVILPLAKPGLAVMGIFSFVAHWNDFFWPLLVTESSTMRTIQVGLASFKFVDSTMYGPLMAGSVVASIPMFILFFSLQKYFLQGITIGAIKG